MLFLKLSLKYFYFIQSEDADLMLERMDEQMKTLSQAHKSELNNIEASFYSERRDILQAHKNKQFVFLIFYFIDIHLFIYSNDFWNINLIKSSLLILIKQQGWKKLFL